MESPDVVDTSDVEEREVFTLSQDTHHRVSPALTPTKRTTCANALASPQSATAEKDHQRRPNSLILTTRCDRFSDHEAENPSPRKRIKVYQVPLSPSDIDFPQR